MKPCKGRTATRWGRVAVTGVSCLATWLSVGLASAHADGFSGISGSPFTSSSYPLAGAFNLSGDQLAVANGSDGTLSLYSKIGDSFDLLGTSTNLGGANSVAWNQSGTLITTADNDDNKVYVLHVNGDGTFSQTAALIPSGNDVPYDATFNPTGTLLAVADQGEFFGGGSVSVYSVNSDGTVNPAATTLSDGTTPSAPEAVAFSPSGNLLAVADLGSGTVAVFTVNADGSVDPTPQMLGTVDAPVALAFNPSGSLLAVANSGDRTASVFSVGDDGTVNPSPQILTVGAADYLQSIAFSSTGALLAATDSTAGTVDVFPVTGGTVGTNPLQTIAAGNTSVPFVAFSSLGFLAYAALSDTNVNILAAPRPSAQISGPTSGDAYTVGQNVPATFSCAAGAGGFAVSSCVDSQGVSDGSDALDTSTPGSYTYTVTATSLDGSTGTAQVSYTVNTPPSATIGPPTSGGVYALGQVVQTSFSCTESGDGPGIASCVDSDGANGDAGRLDTSTLGSHTYVVTATSSDGLTGTATIDYTVVGAPSATITAPTDSGSYTVGQAVLTSFTCADGAGAPGLSSCVDSNGADSGAGELDTSTPGSHTYVVTATSRDGGTRSASITYVVNAPPPTTTQTTPSTPTTTQTTPSTPTTPATSTTPTTPTATPPPVVHSIAVSRKTVVWCRGSHCTYPNATLSFRATRAESVRLLLRIKASGHWRQVGVAKVKAHAGLNRIRIAGRWHGALVPARKVELLVQSTDSGHWRTHKTLQLTVVHTGG